MSEIILPVKPREPEINASSIILFGKEKCGKTTALSLLPNCLIIDTEKGTRKSKSLAIEVPEDLGPVGKMQWLEKLADKLIAEGKPYDYVALDTFTEINEWAEWSGTYRYMNSIQGKKFNRVKDKNGNPIPGGAFLSPDDPDYESVHTVGEGFGYRWSREDTVRMFNKYLNVSKKCTIFVCHVKDKFVGQKDNTDIVLTKQLALTGAVKDILPRKVDAIGYVYNEKGAIKVNFAGTEDKTGGSRAKHLQGYNDVLDWNKIFKSEN